MLSLFMTAFTGDREHRMSMEVSFSWALSPGNTWACIRAVSSALSPDSTLNSSWLMPL